MRKLNHEKKLNLLREFFFKKKWFGFESVIVVAF